MWSTHEERFDMNERTPTNPDLKDFFELTILKQLFEDVFYAFVSGHPDDMTATDLADQALSIARAQGYGNFGTVYRSQLIDALNEVGTSYKHVCDRVSVLAAQFPGVQVSMTDGWHKYRIYTDSGHGSVLKIDTEVRVSHGWINPGPLVEDVVKATVYLVDRYNYDYRTASLTEWSPQDNLVIWRDVVRGNGFLTFILSAARTALTPMRVTVSTSTRPALRPVPPPPVPCPWPGPYPQPCPPGPLPPPVPYWPPPPPPIPPVWPESTLTRQVVAGRTVGGITKGSVLPAGLTFTLFVEWLLRGGEIPTEDTDPTATLELALAANDSTVPAGNEAQLVCTVSWGTAQANGNIQFWRHTASEAADTLVGTLSPVTGQTVYKLPLAQLPMVESEFYATFDYTRQHAQTTGTCTSTRVSYTPSAPDRVFFDAVPLDYSPSAISIVQFSGSAEMNDATLAAGIHLTVPTNRNTICIAFPQAYASRVKWYNTDETFSVRQETQAPSPTTLDVQSNGRTVRYNVYLWGAAFFSPSYFILTI